MIKTLHITNAYHPSSGGIRTFYAALLKAANIHRRQLRLVVPGPESSVEEVGEYGQIYTIAAPRAPVFDRRYHMLMPQDYVWPGETALRRILAEERPDLVEICDKFWLAYLPGVLRRQWIRGASAPAIVGLTCERLDDMLASHISTGSAARRLSQFYMRKLYAPRFDFHIAVSDYTAGEVRRALPAGKQDRLFVEPMGVDYELFCKPRERTRHRTELLERLGGSPRTVLLLYAGRLGREKNLLLLPLTLEKLMQNSDFDFRFVIAGSGPQEGQLRAAFDEQTPGGAVFLGQCGACQLAELYAASDAFVHPNAHEPFGIAPLEAMTAGLPLVAPASGGLLTYANRKNAWLTDAAPEAFAAAIRSATSDGEGRKKRLAQARRTSQEFSWSRITARYFSLYDRLHSRFQDEGMGKGHVAWKKGQDSVEEDQREFATA